VASLEEDILVVFYYIGASETGKDERDGLW
jgi:hypothetical protein